MKILESQSAVLTNLEVYQFLSAQAQQYQEKNRRGPANLETVRKEVSRESHARMTISPHLRMQVAGRLGP